MFLGDPLSHAWRTVRSSKRMLFAVGFVNLIVCLPPTLYVLRTMNAVAGHRPDALQLAQQLSPDLMADVRAPGTGFDEEMHVLCLTSLALFFLVRPFVVGAYVGLSATRRRVHFGQFAREGGSVYWKFLRLALVAVVAAYLLSIAVKPLLEQVQDWARLRTETTAYRYDVVTNAVVFGAFHLVAMIFDYARVGIRLARRPGVFAEIGRSALFVLQHPLQTIAVYAIYLGLEVGAIAACGWLVQVADLPGGYLTTTAVVLVLMQLVVTLREAARLFHIAGAWRIRASEAGYEGREEEPVEPEPEDADVLAVPLPWNLRSGS
jgi:hypothetical protein